jgi:hypothetical protein
MGSGTRTTICKYEKLEVSIFSLFAATKSPELFFFCKNMAEGVFGSGKD